ncbi:MAG: tetratricopeptide repeat protein [Thermoanaerobaculia bacterium]
MAVQRDKVIASAEKLVAKGKIEPAIKEYERLLEDNPNDVNTLNRIGDLWVRINRNDEAVKVFGKIADHYSRDGFFLKAIAIYKKINKLDPSKLEIYAKLADLYAKQGLAMEAKSQYQVLADYYLKHGDPGNALSIYRKISELDPNSINVHVKLADLYSQNNQTKEALSEYDRVGRMLLKRGMLDEAVQVFKKALKIDASNVDLVDSLVTALLEAKDYENAQQIVETALGANKNNPRLLSMWARVLIGKGDVNSARSALEKGLAADPNDVSIRETLAELSLKQNQPDRALEMILPLVEKAVQKGERGAAVEMMNRILRVDSGHAPTLERLVQIYTKLNEETNILASMNSLAEAHIARGSYDQASKVLENLIQREPQNAQHRNKLAFVKSQMGGGDTAPVRPRQADVPAPIPVAEVPSVEKFDDGAMSIDLDSSGPIDLDLSADFSTPAPPAPPPRMETAAEPDERNEDLDFITEHLTEAEVFAKYGLAEKAIEHLRAVVERAPKHLPGHDKLFRILLDEGEVDAARTAATQYVALLHDIDDTATIDAVRNEFTSRGHSFGPPKTAPARKPTVERAVPPPVVAPAPPAEDEISFDLESPEALEIEDEHAEVEMELEAEPELIVPEPVALPEPSLSFDELASDESSISFDDAPLSFEETETAVSLDSIPAEPEPEPVVEEEVPLSLPEEPILEEEALPEEEAVPTTLELEPDDELNFGDTLNEAPAAEEPFFGVEAAVEAAKEPESLTQEAIGEIDFYIEQELFDEARTKLNALSERFPNQPDLTKRRRRLDAAAAAASAIAAAAIPAPSRSVPKPAAPVPSPAAPKAVPPKAAPAKPAPPPPPVTLSRDEIENELLGALPEDDDDVIPIPPPPPPASTVPPPPLPQVQEENLFADEDNFFDLAAELESEMEEDSEQISLSEEEQSLEEIFKEFKKGVEQQLDSEDYDTHYNLGIAYKEMGLIDEAIGEFQLASKDAKRAVECASMLGLCFLEKGMPQLAIKWYRKGLEMPEITEDEHVGLLYDLGSAHMEVGDTDNAQKAFMEVYGMNSNYRDIVSRIKQLEDARK